MTELLPVDRYLVDSLPTIWFGVVVFSLAMYVALDGLDFGIGMLYATRDEHERETLLAAFGPIWDANEVWLVAFGTTLLAAFPPIYARLLSGHYLLSIAIVMGLVVRGVAPELREQRDDPDWRRRCDRLFVFGSTVTPLLLGVLVGSWAFGTPTLSVPSLLTGVGLVALCVTSGAAFVAAKTSGSLADAMVRYGTTATVVYLVGVVVLLAVVALTNPSNVRALLLSAPALGAVLATVSFAGAGLAAARLDRHRLWFGTAFGLSFALVGLVAVLLYPRLHPASGLTVDAAVVSPLALNLTTVLGLPVLALVLWYFKFLYGTFAGPVDGSEA
ncbi:cytochrome d ubiquinol oxidase subunit II [Halomicrobium sp. IBSBa]|uniref:cytochrome d ubiquinol oxidase subunit II n=1 Tax=Halomicrobium sp. IBSBa TaxID=2778916 RepID=UPI001ABF90DD|nr:cytochrome d ubiquinol oxidase subunit II [Halomicrobium sp. IBSBa]MBO4248546.1 cytochrome d ubiquinol oxidase subunit II [Halomicrobium sp. IBSBa]